MRRLRGSAQARRRRRMRRRTCSTAGLNEAAAPTSLQGGAQQGWAACGPAGWRRWQSGRGGSVLASAGVTTSRRRLPAAPAPNGCLLAPAMATLGAPQPALPSPGSLCCDWQPSLEERGEHSLHRPLQRALPLGVLLIRICTEGAGPTIEHHRRLAAVPPNATVPPKCCCSAEPPPLSVTYFFQQLPPTALQRAPLTCICRQPAVHGRRYLCICSVAVIGRGSEGKGLYHMQRRPEESWQGGHRSSGDAPDAGAARQAPLSFQRCSCIWHAAAPGEA